AADHHQPSAFNQAGGALIGLGKGDDLDAALRVLDGEDGHAIAFARLQLPAGRDDAADARVRLDRLAPARAPGIVSGRRDRRVGQFRDRSGAERLQRTRVRVDRVAAPVEAEGFLLEAQLLGLGPRRRRRKDQPRQAIAGRRPFRQVPEQPSLAALAIVLEPRAVLAGGVNHSDQPGPQLARRQLFVLGPARKRIERAALDEALEDALVHQPQVEIFAQRMDRAEPSLLGPYLQQRLNRAFTDILDRGQPEPDAAVRLDGERQLTLVDVWRQDRDAAVAALAEVERELVG